MKKPATRRKVGTVLEHEAPQPSDPWSEMRARELCDITGLSEHRLRDLAVSARIPGPVKGRWNGREVVRRLVAARIEKFGAGDDVSMAEAKRQRETHKARREKVAADLAEAKVVPVEDAIRIVTRSAGQVRTRLLAIPAKAAALLEGKDVTEREAVLRRELDDALAELSKVRLDGR